MFVVFRAPSCLATTLIHTKNNIIDLTNIMCILRNTTMHIIHKDPVRRSEIKIIHFVIFVNQQDRMLSFYCNNFLGSLKFFKIKTIFVEKRVFSGGCCVKLEMHYSDKFTLYASNEMQIFVIRIDIIVENTRPLIVYS